MQRAMICLLLEESGYDVIQCESAEAAELVLEKNAGALCLLMTDVQPRWPHGRGGARSFRQGAQSTARRGRHLGPPADAAAARRSQVLGKALGAPGRLA